MSKALVTVLPRVWFNVFQTPVPGMSWYNMSASLLLFQGRPREHQGKVRWESCDDRTNTQKQNFFLPYADLPSVLWSYPTFMKEKYSFSLLCSVRWAKQEQLLVTQGLISTIIICKLFVQPLVCQTICQSPRRPWGLTAGGNRRPEMLDAPAGRALGQEKS